MEEYLRGNLAYWQRGYDAENVESFVFRVYGRILKTEFGLSGDRHEKLLDFGCGEGAALSFFDRKGFDVYGVDISAVDIEKCKKKMPHIADHFSVINPAPRADDRYYGGGYDLVIAIESLFYLSDSDLEKRLLSLKNQMKPGAVFFATMLGSKTWYYNHSSEYGDGLRKIDTGSGRVPCKDLFIHFTDSEEALLKQFHLFEKKHVGYFDCCYIESEGPEFHWIFIGQA